MERWIVQAFPLPVEFNANEWFILLNTVLGYFWVFLVPKRYPRAISILVVFFCVSVAIILDHSIATPPLDLYDINDRKEYEVTDILSYFMYGPYALLATYIYDKLNPRGWYLTAYVIVWSALAVFFEWIASLCHVFHYNHWSLVDSFAVYIIATPMQLSFFRFIRKHLQQSAKTSGTDESAAPKGSG